MVIIALGVSAGVRHEWHEVRFFLLNFYADARVASLIRAGILFAALALPQPGWSSLVENAALAADPAATRSNPRRRSTRNGLSLWPPNEPMFPGHHRSSVRRGGA